MRSISDTPSITAVIPAYNGEQYVLEAVESVLGQDFDGDLECVVVNHGSTSGTLKALEDVAERITIITIPRTLGQSQARNRGADAAKSELLAFLDADDVWLPSKLRKQVDLMRESGADLVMCAAEDVDEHLKPIGNVRVVQSPHPLELGLLLFDGATTHPSVNSTGLFDRSFFENLGGYAPDLGSSTDLDLLIRSLRHGQVEIGHEPLVLYRRHGAGLSRNVRAIEHDLQTLFNRTTWPLTNDSGEPPKRTFVAHRDFMLAGSFVEVGDRRRAARAFLRALRADPLTTARRLMGAGIRRVHRRRPPS